MATISQTDSDAAPWKTHDVTNQPPPLRDVDLFSTNVPLVEAVRREGAEWVLARGAQLGREVGGEPLEWGRLANENRPVLHTHDRYGHRIDEVEFHPAWHELDAPVDPQRAALDAVDERSAQPARRAGGAVHDRDPRGGRRRLPDDDDLRRRAGPARVPRARRGVGAAGHRDDV